MITLSKIGNAIRFTFADSQHYLTGDGTIDVPVNSLSLIFDESTFATFKKAASNDIFVSAPLDEFGMTKAELITFYTTNMVGSTGGGGGGGVTSGEVQTMIDNSISGKANISDVTSAVTEITDALEDKVDVSELEEVELAVAQSINVLAQSVSGKQNTLQYITEDTEEGYVDANIDYGTQYYGASMGGTSITLIAGNLNDESDTGATLGQTQIEVQNGGINIMGTIKTYDAENEEWVEEFGTHELQSHEDGLYIDGEKIATETDLNDFVSVSEYEDAQLATSNALNNLNTRVNENTTALGGITLLQISQTDYDALTDKDPNTLYIIITNNNA